MATTPDSNEMESASIPNRWTPRRLLDLPEFEGQSEEWPIFQYAFTETRAAYQCTAHPPKECASSYGGFRCRRPKQLIRSQLESVRDVQPISKHPSQYCAVRNKGAFLKSMTNGIQH